MERETPLQRLRRAERGMTSAINQGFDENNLEYIRRNIELQRARKDVEEWRAKRQRKSGVIW